MFGGILLYSKKTPIYTYTEPSENVSFYVLIDVYSNDNLYVDKPVCTINIKLNLHYVLVDRITFCITRYKIMTIDPSTA